MGLQGQNSMRAETARTGRWQGTRPGGILRRALPVVSLAMPLAAGVSLALLLTAGAGWNPGARAAGADGVRPPDILSWRHECLADSAYARLSREWEEYVGKNPQDAKAWVQWGNALRYCEKKEEREKAQEMYARAFAIDSTDAVSVLPRCQWLIYGEENADLAYDRLLRARRNNPAYPDLYYTLWIAALRKGDDALARDCMVQVVRLGDMPKPVLDFGANLILGAPEDAIIFTNGDNDTFSPCAYQALSGERADVAIVNLSLLNVDWYVRYWKNRGLPITLSDAEIGNLKWISAENTVSTQVQKHLYESLKRQGWPRPLCYAVTVNADYNKLVGSTVLEGLLERCDPKPPPQTNASDSSRADATYDWPRIRLNLDTVYRLDSMTDPTLNWEHEGSVRRLGKIYSTLCGTLGGHLLSQGAKAEAGTYMFRAVRLCAFHGDRDYARSLVETWAKEDPQSTLLGHARNLLK
jgi:tetratricopeptide (TPR) repeat protein